MGMSLLLAGVLCVSAPAPEDPTVRRLVEALKDTDFEVRQNVAAALAKAGRQAVEPLREALKDRSVERRAGAAYTLGLLGEAGRPALAELLDALSDPEVEVRRQVSFAIGRVMPVGRLKLAERATGGPR